MQPNQYTGKEWDDLLRQMNGRQVKNSMRRAIRADAKTALEVARKYLRSSGLTAPGKTSARAKKYKGNPGDWSKGVRSRIYPDRYGAGFLITVKAHRATQKQMAAGNPGKGMHKNRFGFFKPVLQFAEEGTTTRQAKYRGFHYEQTGSWKLWARHGAAYKPRKRKVKDNGQNRGKMPAYGFLDKATPEMYRNVETNLTPAVGAAVENVAKKCGFI